MDKIIRDDFRRLHDFITLHKDDNDSPIVWVSEILEKLARADYYSRFKD